MPEDQSRFIDREPHTEENLDEDFEEDVVEERADGKGELPHWADWAPSKVKLWLALGPIIGIPLIINPVLWVGRVWMATNAPLLLMALSNKAIYLAAAASQVPVIAYFLVAIIRRVLYAPCYFFLGRWGSDRGLEWMAKNSPSSARILDRLRRWFPAFGPVLVMFYPAPIVRVLAGASKMRVWVFMVYEFVGAAGVATAVFVLTRQFPSQMDSILEFIQEYTWQLTIASLVYVALIVYIGEKRNPSRGPDLEELEETMEKSIEQERHR